MFVGVACGVAGYTTIGYGCRLRSVLCWAGKVSDIRIVAVAANEDMYPSGNLIEGRFVLIVRL
jgi:hypothetical protein